MSNTLDITSQNRLDHLKLFLFKHYRSINDFCKQNNEDYASIYRYLQGGIKIGSKVTRRLESIFNVEPGTFDKNIEDKSLTKLPVYDAHQFKDGIENNFSRYKYLEDREIEAFGWNKEKLFILIARDDGMQPLIMENAEVLVDGSQTEIISNKIYALFINDQVYIRRIIKSTTANAIELIPENKNSNFKTEKIVLSKEIKILGRIVYLWAAI